MPKPQVFAYYFPNYHSDARNAAAHGEGWDEWRLVQEARPRFEGHVQPKEPLWGYQDEADPRVMAGKIDAAAAHGVDGFLFDWYWYEDGPFLQRALDEGFLGATNNGLQKFALMWANHDWVNIHPASSRNKPPLQYPGAVSRAAWEKLTDYVVEKYFSHPSYLLIDGCPYFSIYELATFIQGLGQAGAGAAMESFRSKVKAAGFPDLHLNIVAWGLSPGSFQVLPVESRIASPMETAQSLGTNSVTPYVWVHHHDLAKGGFPVSAYQDALLANVASWDEASAWPFEFFPNVTMGWDASPRTRQDEPFENTGYPFMSMIYASPQEFEAALLRARSWMEAHPTPHAMLTINAWNEWTEGSYLEPDTRSGLGYLEAIKRIFG